VTNRRMFERPLPIQSAWKQVENWLDCPTVRVPVPGDRYREILGKLMREFSVRRLRVRGSEFEFRVWSSEPIVLVLVVVLVLEVWVRLVVPGSPFGFRVWSSGFGVRGSAFQECAARSRPRRSCSSSKNGFAVPHSPFTVQGFWSWFWSSDLLTSVFYPAVLSSQFGFFSA